MTKPKETSKKTKQQLKRTAMNALLSAVLIAVFPLIYFIDYERFGFIYSGKPRIIKTTGTDALIIMYGSLIVAIVAALYAGYIISRCIIKIRRGDYSEIDESPDLVICKQCKEPQKAKDLVNGHCAKCSGEVEALEGYYERHPEQRNG
jgi:hypothetical protein